MADVLPPNPSLPMDGPAFKRKRDPSRSPSPPSKSRRRSTETETLVTSPEKLERIKIDVPNIVDYDTERRKERERQLALRLAQREAEGDLIPKKLVDPKVEMAKLAMTRGGGAYIPPHRLRAMLAEQAELDNQSAEYQRLRWDALRKSINGLINKVNIANIKMIIPEVFGENLDRGRGLFARSVMRAQAASLPYTSIFAALVAVVNTKLPALGELVLTRLILQFRRSFRRNDKVTCIATTTFLAHLCNQRVAHEMLALQVLALLLERPTNDSVEIAVGFMKEVGALLNEIAPKPNNSIFELFRDVLHRSDIDKRTQYAVEILMQIRREKFKDNPIIPDGLDLVEEEDAITHMTALEDDLSPQDTLNIFKFDPDFDEHEEEYEKFKKEILGSEDEDSSDEDDDVSSDEEAEGIVDDGTKSIVDIHDKTGTNIVNFRRKVYLTLMSALDFEEAVHKLLKMVLPEGMEIELCNMVVECCSQERSYNKFYGLIGERLCKLNPNLWAKSFDESFRNYYNTIHRYESNRLRNIARFFGHLLATDAILWSVFEIVRMTEEETTSSSRIFIKILFGDMMEILGMKKLQERCADPEMQQYYQYMFPKDNPKNTRFSINFWTSIKLGTLTENMREHLKRAPQLIEQQRQALEAADPSSSSSSSDVSSSSDEDSETDSRSPSPPPRRIRRQSSTPPRKSREDTYRKRDSSPPRRRREYSDSPPRRSRHENDDRRDSDRRR